MQVFGLVAMIVCLVVAAGAAIATAETGGEEAVPAATAPLMPATNSNAAEALPHDDLDRSEAAHLLQAVFEESLDAPSSVFDDLQIKQFQNDHVAVVESSSPHNGLLQSLLPLRTETENGAEKVVDLDLVPVGDGELEPSNPLVELAIPSELGDGIALPESSIELSLAGAPADRAPSVIDGGAAFYPNVAPDSDFTVVPTPTGVETFSHLRTPDAPLSQTYELGLPSGAVLEETPDGGAVARQGGSTIAVVRPPSAIDAHGESVPVSMEVVGSSLVVSSAPTPESVYPILVDPLVESYYWSQNNNTDGINEWAGESNDPYFETRSYGYGGAEKGLNIYSLVSPYGQLTGAGALGKWIHQVPRYDSDYATYGTRPSTFINNMKLSNINFWREDGTSNTFPLVRLGLRDPFANAWVSYAQHTGANGDIYGGWTELKNPNENVNVKTGVVSLSNDNSVETRKRHLWVGQATVELSDKDYPSFASAQGPSKWQNGNNSTPAEAIQFEASDAGLGVYALLAKTPKLGGGTNQWEQTPGCPGNSKTPCPRVWKGGYWNYNPTQMPQGENTVELIGKDPIWHFSDQASPSLAAKVKVKVDRTQPTISLSGTLTEQATLGEWLPSYTLKMDATDGVEGAPQSGVAKLIVKVDGVVVHEFNPGCATKNCALSHEWTLDADDYWVGSTHHLMVTAVDGAGLSKNSSTLYFGTRGDRTDPTVALSGTMTNQANLGTTRPSYKLNVSATDPGPSEERKSGVAATTIKVDGVVVDSVSPGCSSGGCSITREWTLNSDSYSVGAHDVEVKATDDAGRTTTKTLTINIARDTTPPQLSPTDTFYTAPEGWLEHKAYSYLASASDNNGYGVTSIKLKIDGNVVKEASGVCPVGNCMRFLGLGQTIDMTTFEGGAHPAELIATDGAGNTAKRSWTINVDPLGNISVSEATDTLEAVEETAPEATELTPVESLVSEQVSESGRNPQLALVEGQLVSKGTPAPSTVGLDPENGFTIETTALDKQEFAQSETIEIVPVQVGGSATEAKITDGSAAVISNSPTNVDTIIRPAFDGLMAFQAIRDTTAPESYSWEVKLAEGETLQLIDEQHAGIFWEDGTQAMLISGRAAHGADGKAVATSLSVSEGNIITLTVSHNAEGVVYPVVAGVGWEGGFQTHKAEIVVPEEELGSALSLVVAPPELVGYEPSGEGASASGGLPKTLSKWGIPICDNLSCDIWERRFRGFHYYNFNRVWWVEGREPVCLDDVGVNGILEEEECAWVGPNFQPLCKKGTAFPCVPLHITARTRFQSGRHVADFEKKVPMRFVMRAWSTGDIRVYQTDQICNPMKPECTGKEVANNED